MVHDTLDDGRSILGAASFAVNDAYLAVALFHAMFHEVVQCILCAGGCEPMQIKCSLNRYFSSTHAPERIRLYAAAREFEQITGFHRCNIVHVKRGALWIASWSAARFFRRWRFRIASIGLAQWFHAGHRLAKQRSVFGIARFLWCAHFAMIPAHSERCGEKVRALRIAGA